MSRPGRKTRADVRPNGQIRQSQIVTTFGPGAMVDLPDHAVIVGRTSGTPKLASSFALIVSSALEAGCETLYTEDLQSGQVIDGRLTFQNPF